MADRKTLLAVATGAVVCLAVATAPGITFAGGYGGGGGGGGKCPKPPPQQHQTVNKNVNANNNSNSNSNYNNVGIGITVENNIQNTVQAQSNASVANQAAIANFSNF